MRSIATARRCPNWIYRLPPPLEAARRRIRDSTARVQSALALVLSAETTEFLPRGGVQCTLRFMLALLTFGLGAGCSFFPRPSPPLANELELSPSPVAGPNDDEEPDAPHLMPPYVPDDDERPDAPRLFPIKYQI